MTVGQYALLTVQALLAGLFAVASFSKLRGRDDFGRFVTTVRKLTMRSGPSTAVVAAVFAVVEAVTAVLIAVPATARAGFALATGLLALLIGVVFRAVRGRVFAECGCFGRRSGLMSYPLLVRNVFLLAMALAGLVLAPSGVPVGHLWHGVALAAGIVLASLLLRGYDLAVAAVFKRLRPEPAA
ncbi:MauE/DoxX family redox-associated membrane protein [Actinomadura sp. WMMB 499]|uniref:MauE/DoxX family redox-associated membrane protein n=1 Tax=Actinomadura sp. WMMB 499 TaxID=1219491 RepID=UPI001248DC9A|nr:MauE/DoxX family redox-associated membrane protein [Actinomadura sp. WMMB 499]QFG20275.1 methylamine utilization protein MauE [Actinomadura sp. WMMB 499]